MLQKKTEKNKKTKKEIRQKYWWNYSLHPPPPRAPQLRGPCMFAPEMTSIPVFDFDGESRGEGGKIVRSRCQVC